MVVDVTGEPGAPMMIVGFGVFGASGSVTVSALKVYHLAN